MLWLLVSLLFSLGSINALIPIILILLLIVAAAGLNRGFSLFNIFGISTLAGINPGGKSSIAGKTAFSVLIFSHLTKTLVTTGAGTKAANRVKSGAKKAVQPIKDAVTSGVVARYAVSKNRSVLSSSSTGAAGTKGKAAAAGAVLSRPAVAAYAPIAAVGRARRTRTKTRSKVLNRLKRSRVAQRVSGSKVGQAAKRHKGKIIAAGVVGGTIAAGALAGPVGAAAVGAAAIYHSKAEKVATVKVPFTNRQVNIPLRRIRAELQKAKKKFSGQKGSKSYTSAAKSLAFVATPAGYVGFRGYQTYKKYRDSAREVKEGERYAGVRKIADDIRSQHLADHKNNYLAAHPGATVIPPMSRAQERAMKKEINQTLKAKTGGKNAFDDVSGYRPPKGKKNMLSASASAVIAGAASAHEEFKRPDPITGKRGGLRGAGKGLVDSAKEGAKKWGSGEGSESASVLRAGLNIPLAGFVGATRLVKGTHKSDKPFNDTVAGHAAETALLQAKIAHVKKSTNSRMLEEQLHQSEAIIAHQNNRMLLNNTVINSELAHPPATRDEELIRQKQKENEKISKQTNRYQNLKLAIATNNSLPSGQRGQSSDERDRLLNATTAATMATLSANHQAAKAAANANKSDLALKQREMETAQELKVAQDTVAVRSAIAGNLGKVPHTIADKNDADAATQREVTRLLNDNEPDVRGAVLKSDALKDKGTAAANGPKLLTMAIADSDPSVRSNALGVVRTQMKNGTFDESIIRSQLSSIRAPPGHPNYVPPGSPGYPASLYTKAQVDSLINELKG